MQNSSSPTGKKPLILVVAILGLITAILVAAKTKNSLYTSSISMMQNRQTGDYRQEMLDKSNTVMGGETMMADEMGMGVAEPGMVRTMPAPDFFPPFYGGDDALDVNDRVYEKYSSHSLVVNNTSDYMRQIKEYILSVEGRILSSSMGTSDKFSYGYLQAKIPVTKFEESQSRITDNVKKVVAENLNAQDRTGQLVNTQDSLTYLQDQKAELEIQLDEAKTDADKKRLQLQITRLETQIKNAQNQVENTQDLVEYANISIQVSDNERYFNPNSSPDLSSEFERAWESISDVFFLLIRLSIWVVVYGLLWLPVVVIVRWLFGKRANKS